MKKPNRRTYNSDFKRDAITLSNESGKTITDVEISLGIPSGTIGRWKRQLQSQGNIAFPGRGIEALTPDQRRIRELEKELRDAQMERDILKKATAIFSRASK